MANSDDVMLAEAIREAAKGLEIAMNNAGISGLSIDFSIRPYSFETLLNGEKITKDYRSHVQVSRIEHV